MEHPLEWSVTKLVKRNVHQKLKESYGCSKNSGMYQDLYPNNIIRWMQSKCTLAIYIDVPSPRICISL